MITEEEATASSFNIYSRKLGILFTHILSYFRIVLILLLLFLPYYILMLITSINLLSM